MVGARQSRLRFGILGISPNEAAYRPGYSVIKPMSECVMLSTAFIVYERGVGSARQTTAAQQTVGRAYESCRRRRCNLMRALVFELARLDDQGELVLLRWQRAGREVRECARRIEGFVEVDLDAIRLGQFDVQEAAGAIGSACRSSASENITNNS